jgi:hypothetical protein
MRHCIDVCCPTFRRERIPYKDGKWLPRGLSTLVGIDLTRSWLHYLPITRFTLEDEDWFLELQYSTLSVEVK